MSSCKHYKGITSGFTCIPEESEVQLDEGKQSCSSQNKGFYFYKHLGLPDLGTSTHNLSNEEIAYELCIKDIFYMQNTLTHSAEVAINKYHIDGFTVFLCNLRSKAFIKKIQQKSTQDVFIGIMYFFGILLC